MGAIAVIGGTGMQDWPGLEVKRRKKIRTPYGEPSAPLVHGRVSGADVIFLARHGIGHTIPPHRINYRANLWALKRAGVRDVIAIAAVGGIARNMPPTGVGIPEDLIDYTWGREHSYADGVRRPLQHVDFSAPYSERVRNALLQGARRAGVRVAARGVMGVTQGPRLESPAEIRRLQRDGCTMVSMTGMPEAGLARELGLEYAALAVSVNWAAGLGTGDIHAEIETCVVRGMEKVRVILDMALPFLTAGVQHRR
ncbi:MAG: S-methyl-5'-thioinosine phosphorylase [Nevskiales bacterium]|nr:S-methyl-5'-thioinosine phosphorylase [Nevskiales bacterium]